MTNSKIGQAIRAYFGPRTTLESLKADLDDLKSRESEARVENVRLCRLHAMITEDAELGRLIRAMVVPGHSYPYSWAVEQVQDEIARHMQRTTGNSDKWIELYTWLSVTGKLPITVHSPEMLTSVQVAALLCGESA